MIYTLLNSDKKEFNKNPTLLPSSINYKIDIEKLHRKLEFKKGVLIKAEYFKNISISTNPYGIEVYTYSTPVLKCEYEYHVDEQSYIHHRFTRRYWAYIDGAYSTEYKEGPKYYTKLDARNEAVRRRTNIVNDILMSTTGLIYTCPTITTLLDAENASRLLLLEIDGEIDKFTKGISEPIITKITNIDETLYLNGYNIGHWLSNLVPNGGGLTIRQLILSKLSEGMLVPNEIITI
jgi:hypothetical protein